MVVIEIKTEREFVREHLLPHGVYRQELTPEGRARIWALSDRFHEQPEVQIATSSPAAVRSMGALIRRLRGLPEGPPLPVDPADGQEAARRAYGVATGVFAASPTSASFVALVKAALPLLEEKG